MHTRILDQSRLEFNLKFRGEDWGKISSVIAPPSKVLHTSLSVTTMQTVQDCPQRRKRSRKSPSPLTPDALNLS